MAQSPNISVLDDYDRVLFDIDGTLLIDFDALPGAVRFVEAARQAGVSVCFGTNASFLRGGDVIARLRRAGIGARTGEAVTAIEVLAHLVLADGDGSPIPVLAPTTVHRVLSELGVPFVDVAEMEPSDRPLDRLVVAGIASGIDTGIVERTGDLVGMCTKVYVTNVDAGMLTGRGFLPGPAAIVQQLERRCGHPLDLMVAGKPSNAFAAAVNAIVPSDGLTLVVGDTVGADVALAQMLHWDSLLVLSGATSAADLRELDVEDRPTMVVDNLDALLGRGGMP